MSGYSSDVKKCPICGTIDVRIESDDKGDYYYYRCPQCGNFFAPYIDFDKRDVRGFYQYFNFDFEKLKSYLFYHQSKNRPVICSKEYFDGGNYEGWKNYYNLTPEMVEGWYPKTFAEKIDYILLYLSKKNNYLGKEIVLSSDDVQKLYFCETNEDANIILQIKYINSYLTESGLINGLKDMVHFEGLLFSQKYILTTKALERVYELQKKQENNKNVFVSMAFNDGTKETREAIRSGIVGAGFSAEFIDEIIHNRQIVPEMLRLIRESRFLILDITEPNFGAYYEAGYAAGLGKEVIVCCKKEIFYKKNFICPHLEKIKEEDKETLSKEDCKYYSKALRPHFDIAQKQTLVWKDYADLTKQLIEWIKFLFDKDSNR